MSTIGIQPKELVNYYDVLSEINQNRQIRNKLLGNVDIRPIDDPSYLISMGTLEKLDALKNRESYIVDTIVDFLPHDNLSANRDVVCEQLTKNYLRNQAMVNIDIEVESYDLVLDLLYNIKQAEAEKLLLVSSSEQDNILKEAEQLFLQCKMEEALEKFQPLADAGNAKAMFFLGELYCWALPKGKIDLKASDKWRKKGAELNDVLCRWNLAYCTDVNDEEKEKIISNVMDELTDLANSGDMYAQEELGSINYKNENYEMALKWCKLAAEQGYFSSMNLIGTIYYRKGEYSEANKWYQLAGEAGFDWGWHNLANNYLNGLGVSENKNKGIELHKKVYELKGNAAGDSANAIGVTYHNMENYSEANKWYQLAGEAGCDWGWNNLANNYLWGHGAKKDKFTAITYYKKACALKGPATGSAAFQIGSLLKTTSTSDAEKWYKIAADAGNDDAKKELYLL